MASSAGTACGVTPLWQVPSIQMFGPSPHIPPQRHPFSSTSAEWPCTVSHARTASRFLLFPREKHELPMQIVTFTIGVSPLTPSLSHLPAPAQAKTQGRPGKRGTERPSKFLKSVLDVGCEVCYNY